MNDTLKANLTNGIDINLVANKFVVTISAPHAGYIQRTDTKASFIAGVDYGVRLLSLLMQETNKGANVVELSADLDKQLEELKNKIINGELEYEEPY